MHSKALIATFGILLSVSFAGAQAPRDPSSERVDFTLKFHIASSPDTRQITMNVLIPVNIEGKQSIVHKKYSLRPEKEFEQNGSTYARFVIDNPPRSLNFSIDFEAVLYECDISVATARKGNVPGEAKNVLAHFLAEEKYLETKESSIQKAARSIPGGNDDQGVRGVMDFVVKTLRKTPFDPDDHGAAWALKNKHGDCTEYADLFVTLCRAKGIPARVCEGYITTDVQRNDTAKHNWAEIYFDELGWAPVDPFHTFLKLTDFDHMRPAYIYLSNQRVDKTLNGFHFWSYRNEGGPVKVEDSFTVTKRRVDAVK